MPENNTPPNGDSAPPQVVKVTLDEALIQVEELTKQLSDSTKALETVTKDRNALAELIDVQRRAKIGAELKQFGSYSNEHLSKMSLDQMEHDLEVLKLRKPTAKNIQFSTDANEDEGLTVGSLYDPKVWGKQ